MKRAVVLQGTCCRNYVQIHSTVLGFGKIRMLLCVHSLCVNQLKSIDILESKLEYLKEEVGPILRKKTKDLSQILLKNIYPNEFVNGIF